MIFAKPPLVELIAELRWGPPRLVLPAVANVQVNARDVSSFQDGSRAEELYVQFGARVATRGYISVERVVPPGFPIMPYQAVTRYRHSDPKSEPTLYQLGPSVLTINAVPPYKNWVRFKPVVQFGVESLLGCVGATADLNLNVVQLRYIDAFNEEIRGGMDTMKFLKDRLGFGLNIPQILTEMHEQTAPIRLSLQLGMPLHDGMSMSVGLGDGVSSGVSATMMDMSISRQGEVGASLDEIMNILENEHSEIRRAFVDITKPIHSLMEPKEG